MTLLALLRHGETQWSRDKRIQGRTDIPLSPAGRAALAACRIPDAYSRMRLFSSPLQRCVQTAEMLGLGLPVLEPRLAEMSWGDWEGKVLPDLRAELGETMAANEARGWDFTPDGGESPRALLARVQPWLAQMAAEGKPALAIAHRGVIRVVFASAWGWDMCGKPPAKLDWNALQVFRLDSFGRPELAELNIPLAQLGAKGEA